MFFNTDAANAFYLKRDAIANSVGDYPREDSARSGTTPSRPASRSSRPPSSGQRPSPPPPLAPPPPNSTHHWGSWETSAFPPRRGVSPPSSANPRLGQRGNNAADATGAGVEPAGMIAYYSEPTPTPPPRSAPGATHNRLRPASAPGGPAGTPTAPATANSPQRHGQASSANTTLIDGRAATSRGQGERNTRPASEGILTDEHTSPTLDENIGQWVERMRRMVEDQRHAGTPSSRRSSNPSPVPAADIPRRSQSIPNGSEGEMRYATGRPRSPLYAHYSDEDDAHNGTNAKEEHWVVEVVATTVLPDRTWGPDLAAELVTEEDLIHLRQVELTVPRNLLQPSVSLDENYDAVVRFLTDATQQFPDYIPSVFYYYDEDFQSYAQLSPDALPQAGNAFRVMMVPVCPELPPRELLVAAAPPSYNGAQPQHPPRRPSTGTAYAPPPPLPTRDADIFFDDPTDALPPHRPPTPHSTQDAESHPYYHLRANTPPPPAAPQTPAEKPVEDSAHPITTFAADIPGDDWGLLIQQMQPSIKQLFMLDAACLLHCPAHYITNIRMNSHHLHLAFDLQHHPSDDPIAIQRSLNNCTFPSLQRLYAQRHTILPLPEGMYATTQASQNQPPLQEAIDAHDDVQASTPIEEPAAQLPPVEEEPVVEPTPMEDEPIVEQTPVEEEPIVEPTPVEEEPVVEPTPVEEEPIVGPTPVEEEPIVEPTPVEVEEEPIVEPTPVEEEPVVQPTPVEEEPAVEPTPVEKKPIVEPTSVEEEPAVEPTPVEEEPIVEPTPVEEEPIVEPTPVEEEPAVEPTPVEEEPIVGPTPVEEEPIVEPTPVEEEPIVEPTPVEEEPVVEPTPVEEEPIVEPTPVEEEPIVEPTPMEETAAEEAAVEEPTPAEETAAEEAAVEEPTPAAEETAAEEAAVEEPTPAEETAAEEAAVEEPTPAEETAAEEAAVEEPTPAEETAAEEAAVEEPTPAEEGAGEEHTEQVESQKSDVGNNDVELVAEEGESSKLGTSSREVGEGDLQELSAEEHNAAPSSPKEDVRELSAEDEMVAGDGGEDTAPFEERGREDGLSVDRDETGAESANARDVGGEASLNVRSCTEEGIEDRDNSETGGGDEEEAVEYIRSCEKLGYVGRYWSHMLEHDEATLMEIFRRDAELAIADFPNVSLENISMKVGSLMVDFFVLHPSTVAYEQIHERLVSHQFEELWGYYDSCKKAAKAQKKAKRAEDTDSPL